MLTAFSILARMRRFYTKELAFSRRMCYNEKKGQIARKKEAIMKYICTACGYVYDEAVGDPDNGIAPGTKWEDVPDDFTCPLCGVGKDEFEEA